MTDSDFGKIILNHLIIFVIILLSSTTIILNLRKEWKVIALMLHHGEECLGGKYILKHDLVHEWLAQCTHNLLKNMVSSYYACVNYLAYMYDNTIAL
jgi:hypothetical protein